MTSPASISSAGIRARARARKLLMVVVVAATDALALGFCGIAVIVLPDRGTSSEWKKIKDLFLSCGGGGSAMFVGEVV